MATIELYGRINEGKLEIDLPEGLPSGEVKVTIEVPAEGESSPKPIRSLYGLCADLGPVPSAEEIDEARREAWRNFPREDI